MRLLCLFVIAAFCFASCNKQKETTMKMITPVNFSNVRIDDGFWSPRLQSHKDVTLKVCIDQIENQTVASAILRMQPKVKVSTRAYTTTTLMSTKPSKAWPIR